MSAVNPFTPPRAAVDDVQSAPTEFSEPRVWSTRGRVGRLRYLSYTMVGSLVFMGVAGVLAALVGPMVGAVIMGLAYIPLIVLAVFTLIQRSHDMGWSGWASLLAFIPLVGLIWVFKAGTPGENRFGAPPKPNTTGVKVGASLILVVFLLGILAAIALPAYQQYVMRAKAAQMQSQPPAQ
jgi:uncharacterized membrane protein YhaH (DUF805 family)